MMKIGINTWIMAVCWVIVTALGVYLTFYEQPAALEHLEKAEQVAKMKEAELAALRTEEASFAHMADDVVRKWHARYKIIPKELSTADIVAYLNDLTKSGFKNFDVTLGGEQRTGDYSYYVFNITGRAYYTSLYQLIWELENNRNFYRLHNLSLDHIDLVTRDKERDTERLEVMVSFSGRIEAYFNGIEGASAPRVLDREVFPEQSLTLAQEEDLPPVPREFLPSRKPATNPFFPAIMEQIPPNTYGLIEIETAELVSIVGDKAVFRDKEGLRSVGVGDHVYLGVITSVDPATGRVIARLNKGGIYDEVIRDLETEERYRQAQGPSRLSPLN